MNRRGALPVAAVALAFSLAACSSDSTTAATRERAYRANNVGVAFLEQLKYPEAAGAFRDALTVDAALAIAHVNLSLARFYAQDLEGAEREASEAARLMPSAPQPPYILGLVARAQNRNDNARGFFERVRQIDAGDVGAAINVAQIALEERRYDAAIAALGPVVGGEPYNVTASYVLGLAMTRGGDAAAGQRLLERAQALRQTGYAVTFGNGYLEQGHYAEAILSTGAEPDLVDAAPSRAKFTAAPIDTITRTTATGVTPFGRRFSAGDLDDAGARALAAALGGGLTLLDADADGNLDLFIASAGGQRLLRNEGAGAWRDVTTGSGLETLPPGSVPIGAVSADYDNDGFDDLFVMRYGGSSLYHNDGNGHFSDVTRQAGLPAYPYLPGAAAFVDVDHDGDVDLVIAGLADLDATRRGGTGSWSFPHEFAPAPLQLLRNNRNGTFTDVTREARLDHSGHAVAIVPTDYDNHRDIDLLVVNRDAAPSLFANQRDGTFRDVTVEVGLAGVTQAAGGDISTATVGDINKDEWPDLFFAGENGGVFAMSDGRGRFAIVPAPAGARAVSASQLADYDGDGLLDLLTWGSEGPRLFRNLGREWRDVSGQAFDQTVAANKVPLASSRAVVLADLDKDGHTDVVTSGGGSLWLWRNSGDDRYKTLRVELRGRVSNRGGVGARIQARAGSLSARLDVSAATPAVAPADLVFGLGRRPGADVVRVLWPSGILQAEAPAAAGSSASTTLPSPFAIEELDRKPSSCPFLYVWNGERFEFVTDFLGGGEMGYWEGPGSFNRPNPVEYVRIRGDQLRPRAGRLTVQVTNELEEVLYLDRVRLLSIAHPADVEVFPNEGMTDPPKPFRLHAVRNLHPPRAVDDHGHDVTERISHLDRRYPDDFGREHFRGYAAMHALTLDLGPSPGSMTLLLTGWTDYAFSSDNVAANQSGLSAVEPVLEVKNAAGTWRRLAIPIGIPVGRPQTIALDLAGALRPGEHELRLTTNMRIYWDQILVGVNAATDRLTTVTLDPAAATLSERGFSAEVRPDGQDPPLYDFGRVTFESPWKTFSGRYTRVGDVRALLSRSDDQFVIARPGDAVAIDFDASRLGPLPDGWTQTFLLRGDGFSKEMDINSASPDTVEPLPYHGMSGYPYGQNGKYPDTAEHRRYQETYNTRPGARSVPSLVSSR